MKKFLAVLSLVAFLGLFSIARAGTTSCSASATCSNECDTVTFTVTGDTGCTCSCSGEYVTCSYKTITTSPVDGSRDEVTHSINSRSLRNCEQGDGEDGGSGTGENTNDLGWCTQCYDSNGNLTPLGEFFAGQV